MASSAADIEDTLLYSTHSNDFHNFKASEIEKIQKNLLGWYDKERKMLPWRGDDPPWISGKVGTSGGERIQTSPYGTWVSEIMCQQTRVETAVGYYLKWMKKFPTVKSLSLATSEEVNSLWAGLGYYRRARMLHEGSKYVMEKHNGTLPSSIEELKLIPGIGPYTAGAISSIAFQKPEPLVDGNIIRLVSRLRACSASPKNSQLVKFCWECSRKLVPEKRPGDFNQALMEIGSLVCTPKAPLCEDCPLQRQCKTYALCTQFVRFKGSKSSEKKRLKERKISQCSICSKNEKMQADFPTSVDDFPRKSIRGKIAEETFRVFAIFRKVSKSDEKSQFGCEEALISADEEVLLARRKNEGLLAGQWECPSEAMTGKNRPEFDLNLSSILPTIKNTNGLCEWRRKYAGKIVHLFSHRRHLMHIERIDLGHDTLVNESELNARWMSLVDLNEVGITTGTKKVLKMASTAKIVLQKRKRSATE